MMTTPRVEIEAAIAALEAQRSMLGAAVVDMAVAPLQAALGTAAPAVATNGDAEAKLKQLSVMFIDVVGSTAIGSRLDPEDIHELMDPTLREFTAIVEAHHGRVLKYTGDGLLAAFGVDESREDDAENATHAGLAILGALTGESGAQLRVRVGIDTGPVLVGGGLEGVGNIRGSTVNFAARMEQHAPVGGLRISYATYRMVRGLFDAVEQPLLTIKGFAEPVRTYLIERAKPRAFRTANRGIEGVETPMIGRTSEFAQITDALRVLSTERRYQSVMIIADAGVGKSRLLYEVENWADVQADPYVICKGRAHPYTRGHPYGLLRDVVAWRFQIADSDPADVARNRLIEGMAPYFGDDESSSHLLGHLIGMDFTTSRHIAGILGDPQQVRLRAFRAGAELFKRMASAPGVGAPVVVLIEDLHWADDGTLDFLGYVAEQCADAAVIVVSSARPELLSRRGAHGGGGRGTRIELAPLDLDATDELADVLLAQFHIVPPGLRSVVTQHGQGNPFFMEELVKMLLDDGVITVAADGRWQMDVDRLNAARVPATLLGVLQSRFDALSRPDRAALQAASVIGFVTWDEAVEALLVGASACISNLVNRGFLVVQPTSSVAGSREFMFQHHLMHQFVYDTILKRARRQHHRSAAEWLVSLGADRGIESLGRTGEHYERADVVAEAVACYTQAAERAAARYANDAVLDYVARALRLLDGVGERFAGDDDSLWRWRLLVAHEAVLSLGDDRATHRGVLDALDVTADLLDDDRKRADALLRRSEMLYAAGDHVESMQAAHRVIDLARGPAARQIAAKAYGLIGSDTLRLGLDHASARESVETGLVIARQDGDHRTVAGLLVSLAVIAELQGDQHANESSTAEALQIARVTGDRLLESRVLVHQGCDFQDRGNREPARQAHLRSMAIARDLGYAYGESIALLNLATIAHDDGAYADSAELARRSADVAVLSGSRDLEGAALYYVGIARLELGELDSARVSLERSRDLFELNEGPHYMIVPTGALARLHLLGNDPVAALAEANKVFDFMANGGSLAGTDAPFRSRWNCYEVFRELCDPRAAGVLVEAHDALVARAARLHGAARDGFLHHIPHHEIIVREWEAANAQDRAVVHRDTPAR